MTAEKCWTLTVIRDHWILLQKATCDNNITFYFSFADSQQDRDSEERMGNQIKEISCTVTKQVSTSLLCVFPAKERSS
jgi:hypothetical protein